MLYVVEIEGPDAWASFLINGDDSGLDAAEKAEALAWVKAQGIGFPVSCEDAGYASQSYTFLVERAA